MTWLAITGVVTLLGFLFLLAVVRSQGSGRGVSLMTWNELVAQLQPVKTEGITALALDHLEPEGVHGERDPDDIWDLVGGVDGLTRMKENSNIFIALASYAQRLSPEGNTMVAARLRRDDLALRRAVLGLAVGKTLGYGRARVSLYVHEAASAYYLMQKRLLALYRASQPALYPVLDHYLEGAHQGESD
jgi:hypothetical protein